MKRVIKVLSLLLVAFLVVSLMGCGEKTSSSFADDSNEQVTLKIVYPFERQKDAGLVEEAINEELETLLPNTKLEIYDGAGFAEKWALWMATKKEFDIAHSGYTNDIGQEANSRSIIALDELVEEYAPNIKALMEEYEYTYMNAKVNGKLYAIPNTQIYPKDALTICIEKELQAYVDTAALYEEGMSNLKATEKLWQILTEGLEKAEKAGINVSNTILPMELYDIAKKGYHFISGTKNICYDDSDDVKIMDYYTTDEFKTYCEYTKRWAEKGWISKDALINDEVDGIRCYPTLISNVDPETKANTWQLYLLDDPDYVSQYIPVHDKKKEALVTNLGEQSTYFSIPFTSKHPARAMKFLDLINSEEGAVICNLLAFGIEGKHYEVIDAEKGEIDAFEYEGQAGSDCSYGIPNWAACNTMLEGVYIVNPYGREQYDVARNYYKSLKNQKRHSLYGLSFQTSEIESVLGIINKNNEENEASICCGVVENTDSLYNELLEKNKAAGIEKVIEAFQKQADEYVKNKS